MKQRKALQEALDQARAIIAKAKGGAS